MLENAARDPVMWLEAPVSSTHRVGSRSPALSKVARTLFSRKWSEPSGAAAGDAAGVNSSGGSMWGSIPFSPESTHTDRRSACSSSSWATWA
jgi:hypothetical protein